MAITILRKTGLYTPWGKVILSFDDEKETTIENNQLLSIELHHYPSRICIKGDPLTACISSNHQAWLLVNNPFYLFLSWSSITLALSNFFMSHFFLRITLILLSLISSFVAIFFIPRFQFKPLIPSSKDIKNILH